MIDDDGPFLQGGGDPIEDAVDDRVVRQHDVDAIHARDGGLGRGRDLRARRLELARLGLGAVPHRDLRVTLQEMPDHPGPEESGSEQRDSWH